MNQEDKKAICESCEEPCCLGGVAELKPFEPGVTLNFDPRSLQWVESDITYEYNDDGEIIYSHETSYRVPDMDPVELYDIISSPHRYLLPFDEGEETRPAPCPAGKTEDAAFSDSDVFKLSPKGVALMACIESGLFSDITDRRFDKFWDIFQSEMIKNGYAEGDE